MANKFILDEFSTDYIQSTDDVQRTATAGVEVESARNEPIKGEPSN